jgi:hypothetical protein
MSDLYGDDILLWSKQQAELLRRMAAGERVDDQVDWPNVIEEIESVGRAELRAVRLALRIAMQHKLYLLAWPNDRAVHHWAAEVTNQLAEAHEDFRESMRKEIDLASLYRRARLSAEAHMIALSDQCPWSLDELLAEGKAVMAAEKSGAYHRTAAAAAIVTANKLGPRQHAEAGPNPEAQAAMPAWLKRAMRGRGPSGG